MKSTKFLILLLALVFAVTSARADVAESLDVVLLGDSNIWIGGDDCSKPESWSKWFADEFKPASIKSYARSGATWTNTASTKRDIIAFSKVLEDNNVIYNQVERLLDDVKVKRQVPPEVILIAAGTNDAWFANRRPNIFSVTPEKAFGNFGTLMTTAKPSEATSLAESVRLSCELLMENLPETQIVLITPVQAPVCDYDRFRQVADIIEECGRRMSLGVIRLDNGTGIYSPIEKNSKNLTSDGVHTSQKGAKRLGKYIANQLHSILCY